MPIKKCLQRENSEDLLYLEISNGLQKDCVSWRSIILVVDNVRDEL